MSNRDKAAERAKERRREQWVQAHAARSTQEELVGDPKARTVLRSLGERGAAPRVYISIPVHYEPSPQFVWSLLPLQRHLALNGIESELERFLHGDSLITRARNALTHQFMTHSKCTHQLWLDADLEFSCDDIVRMVRSGHDIAAAPYPKKCINWEFVQMRARLSDDPAESLADCAAEYVINVDEGMHEVVDGWMPVRRAGTGCMLVARGVYEGLEREEPDAWYANNYGDKDAHVFDHWRTRVVNHELVSEDWDFCDRARALGYHVMLDLQAKLGHVGTHTFRGDLGKQYTIHE